MVLRPLMLVMTSELRCLRRTAVQRSDSRKRPARSLPKAVNDHTTGAFVPCRVIPELVPAPTLFPNLQGEAAGCKHLAPENRAGQHCRCGRQQRSQVAN
jgi:hypothetical protein